MSDLDDEDITPEEAAEAAELARLLAGGRLDEEPSVALQTAALLRAASKPELSQSRHQAILANLLAAARPQRAPTLAWTRWLWLAVPAAAGGFAVWQVSFVQQPQAVEVASSEIAAPAEQMAAGLPLPSPELLRLQSVALQGQDQVAYERELSSYRGEVLALLEARFE